MTLLNFWWQFSNPDPVIIWILIGKEKKEKNERQFYYFNQLITLISSFGVSVGKKHHLGAKNKKITPIWKSKHQCCGAGVDIFFGSSGADPTSPETKSAPVTRTYSSRPKKWRLRFTVRHYTG